MSAETEDRILCIFVILALLAVGIGPFVYKVHRITKNLATCEQMHGVSEVSDKGIVRCTIKTDIDSYNILTMP